MGRFVLIFMCMHMLFWAGCQSAAVLHMLGLQENLLGRAIDSSQIYKSSWRKLLEEGTLISTAGKAVVEVLPNNNFSFDEHVKIDKAKSDTTHLTAQVGEDRSEGAVRGFNSSNETDEFKREEASAIDDSDKEEAVSEMKGSGLRLTATQNDTGKVEEPKSNLNQGALKDERSEGEVSMVDKENVEISRSEPAVNSEGAQTQAEPTSDGDKSGTAKVVIASRNQDHGNSTTAKNSEDAQEEDAPGRTADLPDKNESKGALPKSMSNSNSSTDLTQSDTQIKLYTRSESGGQEPQDISEKEKSSSRENPVSKEELAEENPIKMVTSSETEKVEMANPPPDAVNDKEKISDEFEKNVNVTNIRTERSVEKTGNDQIIEDEKIEDKDESTETLEEEEEQTEDVKGIASHVHGDSKVKEMQGADRDDDNRSKESNSIDSSGSEVIESQGLINGSTDIVDDDNRTESDVNEFSVVAKSDDETEAARKEVELQLEALKRDTVIEASGEQMQEMDPSEDEYDIIHELADLPTKFQETAGKVADRLRPGVIKWTDTSKVYFNRANQHMTESFSPLLGKQYAPFVASMISYGILLLPLIVVIWLFDHIKALFSLQKVLLFINIYLAAYFSTLWLASFIIGLEPMSFFYVNSLSSFLSLQLLQGLGYLVYLILQTANIIHSCTSDTLVGKVSSTLQWTVAMSIGLHYYMTVFQPAIVSKPPRTSWKFYAIYASAFFVLCLFARIRWVKKQYVTSGSNIGDKKS